MMYRMKKTWHRVLFNGSSKVMHYRRCAMQLFSRRSVTMVMKCETSHMYLSKREVIFLQLWIRVQIRYNDTAWTLAQTRDTKSIHVLIHDLDAHQD